jgi:hypothetical protein
VVFIDDILVFSKNKKDHAAPHCASAIA